MRKLPVFFILLFSLLILFSACDDKDTRLFRWSNLSSETDSMVQNIQMNYFNLSPYDSLLSMIDHLEDCSDILKTTPEIPFILRAKIYQKMGAFDSAEIFLRKAEALCDSFKHPYEKHIINILKSNYHNAYYKDFEYLENARQYAINTKDTFLLAVTTNILGILVGDLGDSIKNREYTETAIKCYEAINFHRLARSIELNLLPNLFDKDSLLFVSTLHEMMADEYLMADSTFRVNLIIDAASFLKEDWAIDSLFAIVSRPNGLSTYHKSTFLALKADQAFRKGEFQQSYDYSLKSIIISDEEDNLELIAKLFPHHASMCYYAGMPDSAYMYHHFTYMLRDSLNKEDARTKILRATERYEIENSILTRKNKEIRRWLIICIIASSAVILILGIAIWLTIRNGRLRLEAERAKTDTERNRQLVGQTMVRLHEKNQSIKTLSDHIEENIPHSDDLPGLHKEKRILALNERGDKELETTSKLIEEVSSNLVVNLRKRVPNISKNMVQLAVLIACDIPNKEIAEMLGVQPESIRKQRYRLRTLLNLSREEKLEDVLSDMC